MLRFFNHKINIADTVIELSAEKIIAEAQKRTRNYHERIVYIHERNKLVNALEEALKQAIPTFIYEKFNQLATPQQQERVSFILHDYLQEIDYAFKKNKIKIDCYTEINLEDKWGDTDYTRITLPAMFYQPSSLAFLLKNAITTLRNELLSESKEIFNLHNHL